MEKVTTILIVLSLAVISLLVLWQVLGVFSARYSAYEASECLSWQEQAGLWEATNYQPADWMIKQCERFDITL